MTAVAPSSDRTLTPIDEFLHRQHDLSAVDRFSSLHDAGTVDLHAGWYRSLLPASPPGPGQQYRFEVDLDACTACKSCVSACHSLNGLDQEEAWRSVGTVVGFDSTGPTQQTVTTACHHCLDPACLAGCPVDAYDKDPVTGIVAHLDDQCIGCSYCTWTCPYDVPQFNERLGIVRKCDLCRDRLAEGEAPACVQACPNGAISVGVVESDSLRSEISTGDRLVPGAPDSTLTIPTTAYRRTAPLQDDAHADEALDPRPGHAHTPLVAMLVATQSAVGLLLAAALADLAGSLDTSSARVATTVATLATLGGIAASVSHLGRPLQAWRAVLGVRHSWLSREILAFGALAPLTILAALTRWVPRLDAVATASGLAAAAAGVGAVACSAAIYLVTGRRWWSARRVSVAFAGTVALTAGAFATALGLRAAAVPTSVIALCLVLAAHRSRSSLECDGLADSVAIEMGPLSHLASRRRNGRLLVAALAPLALVPVATTAVGLIVAVVAIVAEVAGRQIFFQAMTAPRMPGPRR